jgi:hypothetical protein
VTSTPELADEGLVDTGICEREAKGETSSELASSLNQFASWLLLSTASG